MSDKNDDLEKIKVDSLQEIKSLDGETPLTIAHLKVFIKDLPDYIPLLIYKNNKCIDAVLGMKKKYIVMGERKVLLSLVFED